MELVVEAGSTLAAVGLTERFPAASAVGDPRDPHSLCVKIPLEDVPVPKALTVVRDWLVAYGIESTNVRLNDRRYTMVAQGIGACDRGSDDDLPVDIVLDC
jgi:hypothetical protein